MNEYGEFIKNLLEEINPYEEFEEDTELIESALLDSLTLVFLVSQIEEKYNISIDGELVIPENFTSIRKIGELLKQVSGK